MRTGAEHPNLKTDNFIEIGAEHPNICRMRVE
jgi:hypothetical protein